MKSVGWRLSWAAAIAVAAAACRQGGLARAESRLEVQWTGADTSRFSASATADWCDSLNLLEILAVAGDTGIGIALYPRDSLASGLYPIQPPDAADSVPPSAAIGLRWFSETSVQGYQADSGQVSMTRTAGGALSGRFTATARAITGKGRLRLTGSFEDLRQRPATRGCSTARTPQTPPRGESSEPEEGVD
ncbi:MAG TPA: hypothetical protein VMY76_04480 [Gemmatimonadales bacterium]|nr:hypothetical protein [Gemmatimonadales bacterium]